MVYESDQNSYSLFFNDFLELFEGALIADLVLKTRFFRILCELFFMKKSNKYGCCLPSNFN